MAEFKSLRAVASIVSDGIISSRAKVSRDRVGEDEVQITAWIHQPSISKATKKVYIAALSGFFTYHWNIGLKEVNTAHLSLYLKQRTDLSPSSRNFMRDVLSSLFQFLADTGYVERNPVRVLKREKVPETFQYKNVPVSAINQMIGSTESLRDKLILRTLYYTSVRVSELSSIRMGSFTPHADSGSTLTITGKGSKTRSILTGKTLWTEIRSYQQIRGLGASDYLFFAKEDRQKPLSRVMIWKIVKGAAKRAKLDLGFGRLPSPHWFRHASSMHAIENGAPIDVVQRTLGHESISTTGKYLRARPKKSSSGFLKGV